MIDVDDEEKFLIAIAKTNVNVTISDDFKSSPTDIFTSQNVEDEITTENFDQENYQVNDTYCVIGHWLKNAEFNAEFKGLEVRLITLFIINYVGPMGQYHSMFFKLIRNLVVHSMLCLSFEVADVPMPLGERFFDMSQIFVLYFF